MGDGKAYRLAILIVILVTVIWICLIITVIARTVSKKNRTEPVRAVQKYPAIPNACPAHAPSLYYLDVTRCTSYTQIARNECPSRKVCLPHCPGMTYTMNIDNPRGLEEEEMKWSETRQTMYCVQPTGDEMAPTPISFQDYLKKVERNQCADKVFRSDSFFNHICLPNEPYEPSIQHLLPHKQKKKKKKSEKSSMEIHVIRRSKEMFVTWICLAAAISIFFVVTFLITFIYFLKFMVYASLLSFFVLLLAGLGYSSTMTYYGASGEADSNLALYDLTFGFGWPFWSTWVLILAFFFFIYCVFIRKCYYNIPKAVRFLIYANNGIGGVKSALVVVLIATALQTCLVCSLVYLVYLIYTVEPKEMRVMHLSDDCICINDYKEGSACTQIDFKNWCRHRLSGSSCLIGGCFFYLVDISPTSWFLIVCLGLSTYYLMLFFKGTTEMILGTTFVDWYRDNFSSEIPLRHFANQTVYCMRNHCGTVSIGAAVMFLIGMFHTLFQFIEHLVLYTTDLNRRRNKNLFVSTMDKLSKMTSPLIYVEAGVYDVTYCQAFQRVDVALASKIKNMRWINKIVDMVLFIYALVVVSVIGLALLVVFIFPHLFFRPKSREIFALMTDPLVIFVIIIISCYFVVANILSMYSISVNSIFLCYISDKPAEVSRKRKYRSSALISEALNPDKFDVLGKVNDLDESVSPGDKNVPKKPR